MTNPTMTLVELKELEKKATKEPWKHDVEDDSPYVFIDLPEEKAGPNAISVLFNSDWGTEEDAALIVALHNMARELIAVAEKTREYFSVMDEKFIMPQHDVLPTGETYEKEMMSWSKEHYSRLSTMEVNLRAALAALEKRG